jgi:sigma-B regulation protein RsbU (phosphoserine phosphatase)
MSVEPLSGNQDLSDLRHDLCTPINQILGYSEMLEEDAEAMGQTEVVEDLQKIQSAASNLLTMVRERLTDAPAPHCSDREVPAFSFEVLPGSDDSSEADDDLRAFGVSLSGRILVVDDDELNRDVLAERLSRQGHVVTTACDGEDALAHVRRSSFDLILLDVMMPVLDGYGTLKALKNDEELRSIPVIMISALDELSSVVRCIQTGAHDYLPKPFNATLLKARIGACLREKARHDEEVRLYEDLLKSQQTLQRELDRSEIAMASIDPSLRDDPRFDSLFTAITAMTGAIQRRESDLRHTMKGLEIQINPQALKVQVGSIVSDPSFSALSERARAMRQRRQERGRAK